MSQHELQKFLSKCFRQRVLEALQVLEKGLMRHRDITEELEKSEKDGKIKVLRTMAASMNNIIIVSEPGMPFTIRIAREGNKIIKKLDTECIKLEPISGERSVYRLKLTMNAQRASEILEWLLANRLAIKYGKGVIDDKKVFYTVSPYLKDIYEDLLELVRIFERHFQRINALRNLPETIEDFDVGIRYFLSYYMEIDPVDIEIKHNISGNTVDIDICITKCADVGIYKVIISDLIENLNICQEPKISPIDIPDPEKCGFAITGKIMR